MLLFKKNGVDETFRYKCLQFSIFSWENLKKEPRNILPNEAFEYLSSHLIIWTRKIVHTKYFSTWILVHEKIYFLIYWQLKVGQIMIWIFWKTKLTRIFFVLRSMMLKLNFIHGLLTTRESFFSKIRNFWAWADKLGRNFLRNLGYFRPNYQHYFGTF